MRHRCGKVLKEDSTGVDLLAHVLSIILRLKFRHLLNGRSNLEKEHAPTYVLTDLKSAFHCRLERRASIGDGRGKVIR